MINKLRNERQKFVFFINNIKRLTGNQKYFLQYASDFAELSEHNVYFIANIFEEDIGDFISEKLHIQDISKANFKLFEGANFFLPPNFLFDLLLHIQGIKTGKIRFYIYDQTCLTNLFAQNDSKISYIDFLAQLKATNTCLFADGNIYYNNCVKYGFFNKGLFQLTSIPKKVEKVSKLVDSNTINIGYLNGFAPRDINTLTNLMASLLKIDIDKNVNIHIIGASNNFIKIDLSFYAPKIRIVFAGDIKGEDRFEYLAKNVDLVVGYDKIALDSACHRIPVVLPIVSDKKQADNRYVWLFDVNEKIYQWDRKVLLLARNNNFSINYILHQLYVKKGKSIIIKKCFDYCLENANTVTDIDKFTSSFRTSGLSLKVMRSFKFVQTQLKVHKQKMQIKAAQELEQVKLEEDAKKKMSLKSIIKKFIPKNFLYSQFYRNHNSYKKKIENIKKTYNRNGKIKIGFIVVFNSVFPTRPVFEAMLNDKVFDPYIIVAPNVSRTHRFLIDTYNETYNALIKQYGKERVINGYNEKTDEYLELNDEYSILFFANPYKHLVHKFHNVEYFLDKDVLSVYSSYGFAALKFWEEVIATDFYNYMWKCTIETESNLEHLKRVEKIKGKNGVVTGYIKMDKLASTIPTERTRKRILICPHHTVWGWKNLNISNFLTYSEFFIELPKLFPDIDFVFRPHPLLVANLKEHKVWTAKQIEEYFERLLANPNMTYDTSGDYMQQFADSDGMIHDCGSYIGEYLYTEKPCCYMMKTKEQTYEGLVPLGQACMDQYYHAFNREDIVNFIQNVIIDGNDTMKEQRTNFVKTELKHNYPNATKCICDVIKNELELNK